MSDEILAALSFAGLAAFLMVVVVYVREIDLSIVIIGVLVLAAYDFWTTLRKPKTTNASSDG